MSRFCICLVLAWTVLACAPAIDEEPPATASVLVDAGRSIDRVLLVVSSPRRSALRNQELVERIARSLPPTTRILILADREMVLDPNPWPERMRFIEIPEGRTFTVWPQDPFVVLDDGEGGGRLLAARGYGRSDDREMAGVVGRALGWPVETSSLFFAGGNILADERRAFVGANLVRDNAAELGLSADAIVQRFRDELGRPVFVVGGPEQPVAHMDTVLTPLGDDRVAVADAGLGAEIVARELEARPEVVRQFEEDAQRHFFGHPDLQSVRVDEERVVRAPRLDGVTAGAIEDSRAIAPRLDAIATALEKRGYTVLRVPLLMRKDGQPEQLRTPEGGRSAGYPMLTYNNVLVERAGGRDRVYIPEYGLSVIDTAARRRWEEAGFEVRAIRGALNSSMYRGSLRCSVKVLARRP
jgi:hypothetical protein